MGDLDLARSLELRVLMGTGDFDRTLFEAEFGVGLKPKPDVSRRRLLDAMPRGIRLPVPLPLALGAECGAPEEELSEPKDKRMELFLVTGVLWIPPPW